jgi:hypothetical protein
MRDEVTGGWRKLHNEELRNFVTAEVAQKADFVKSRSTVCQYYLYSMELMILTRYDPDKIFAYLAQ